MSYQKRTSQYNIKTPSRKKSIIRIARRSNPSLVSSLANSPTTHSSVIKKLAAVTRSEMKSLVRTPF